MVDTEDDQCIVIAEAWGFEPGTINKKTWLGYCAPIHAETLYQLGCHIQDSDEKPNHILAMVPNFPGDLNAMHEAEKSLTQSQRVSYMNNLAKVCGSERDKAFATAAQRAKAFTVTISPSNP